MKINLSVQMNEKYLYSFLLYHNYTGPGGALAIVTTVFILGMGVTSAARGEYLPALFYFIGGLGFLLYPFFNLKTKAKNQMYETEVYHKPLYYEVTDQGITVRQDTMETVNAWRDVKKAIMTKKLVIIYFSKVRALIFPKECLGDDLDKFIKMIHLRVSPKSVKINYFPQ